jgi:predicted DNA-binding transcriptional regulator AlpA
MQEPQRLEEAVLSEADLLELLGIDKGTLDDLRREKGFPVVRLTTRTRVYLAKDILGWLEQRSKT